VVVISKNNLDEKYVYESKYDWHFTITIDTLNPLILRVTMIILHLNNEKVMFLNEITIKDFLKKHWKLIKYPIIHNNSVTKEK